MKSSAGGGGNQHPGYGMQAAHAATSLQSQTAPRKGLEKLPCLAESRKFYNSKALPPPSPFPLPPPPGCLCKGTEAWGGEGRSVWGGQQRPLLQGQVSG